MIMLEKFADLRVCRERWVEHRGRNSTHVVEVAGVAIGAGAQVVIAGPCAVESLDQTLTIARAVRAAGATLLRGGSHKPRTSPYSFQGLGTEALEILQEVRRLTGLGIVTEVMDPRLVEQVAGCVDMLQIGSRSMHNVPLLTEAGQAGVPVLLKRGWSATVYEWLCAAEYIVQAGSDRVVLCERGIRTSCSAEYARNVLDLNVLAVLRTLTPLPVLVDPSHAAGSAEFVPPLARASLAGGADGLLIEVTASVEMRARAQCDPQQAILPDELVAIVAYAAGAERGGHVQRAGRRGHPIVVADAQTLASG